MPITWPPALHSDVETQAQNAAGGDYFRSGFYSHGTFTGAAVSTLSVTQSTMYLRPFLVPVRRAFDRIGINVTTGAASAVLRFGIYDNAGGQPGNLVADYGTVDASTSGAKEVTISVTLDPGIYWLACVSQGAAVTVTVYPNTQATPWVGGSPSPPSSTSGYFGRTLASITGALPSSASGTSNGSTTPAASLRAA